MEIVWIRLERCIQAPSLSHIGDINAKELITVHCKVFKLVTGMSTGNRTGNSQSETRCVTRTSTKTLGRKPL